MSNQLDLEEALEKLAERWEEQAKGFEKFDPDNVAVRTLRLRADDVRKTAKEHAPTWVSGHQIRQRTGWSDVHLRKLYKELEAESSKIGVSVLCPEVIKTNIGYAERNRPSDPTRDPDRVTSPIGDMVTKGLIQQAEQGLAPSVMADRVLAAIRENRFYILAEDKTWLSACNARLDDIKHARNPRSDTLEI